MLRAGAEPADDQRERQHDEPGARAGDQVAAAGERGAGREHARGAEPFGQQPGRDLERRQRAGEQAAQDADRRIGEIELALPDRQQHVDEVGVAVVQRMRAAGDAERAALSCVRG